MFLTIFLFLKSLLLHLYLWLIYTCIEFLIKKANGMYIRVYTFITLHYFIVSLVCSFLYCKVYFHSGFDRFVQESGVCTISNFFRVGCRPGIHMIVMKLSLIWIFGAGSRLGSTNFYGFYRVNKFWTRLNFCARRILDPWKIWTRGILDPDP